MLHSTDANLQRTKKQYQQSVDHLTKAIAKQKATADPSKAKAQVGSVCVCVCVCRGVMYISPLFVGVRSYCDCLFCLFQLESRVNQAKTWMETMSKLCLTIRTFEDS